MVIPNNKKMSILCILKVLTEFSDEKHPLTQADIIKKIDNMYGLELERKSIGANIQSLIDFGYDIIKTENGCYLGSRDLEPSEISFLIDAVFSSRSIDSKRSRDLAEKLSKLLSVNERKKYKYIHKADEIVRTDNKQLFYTIDVLNEAIEKGKKVSFNYNRYYFEKETREKKASKKYIINPYFLINNQGRYYLVCNLDFFDEIANYKVELISNIQILDKDVKPITKLKGCEKGVDMAKYANENIYMFHNKTVDATLKIEEPYSAEYVMEWFGKNAKFYEKDNITYADVTANEQALIYWCLQYGDTIELVSPNETREEIKNKISQMRDRYN
jgi:predicted DNA-binding transcriptional regulator YafY